MYGIIKILSPEVFCVYFSKELCGIGYEKCQIIAAPSLLTLMAHGCLGATYGVGAHFDISKRAGDKCIAIRFICRVMNFARDLFEFRVSSTFMTDSI